MARPIKEGVDYFPLDVNFYRNRKLRRVIKAQGEKSIGIWVVVLAMIYEDKGYYVTFDENTCFDIADVCGVEEGAIQEFVKAAVKAGLFNSYMFDTFKILTSKGIQEQYQEIIKKSKRKSSIEKRFQLTSTYQVVSSEETNNKQEETISKEEESTQRKVKESKLNKKKRKDAVKGPTAATNFWEANIGSLTSVIIEKIEDWEKDLPSEVVAKAIEQAVVNNARNWKYVNKILNDWFRDGVKSVVEAENRIQEFESRKQPNTHYRSGKKDIVPDWYKNRKQESPVKPETSSAEQERAAKEADEMLAEYLSRQEQVDN